MTPGVGEPAAALSQIPQTRSELEAAGTRSRSRRLCRLLRALDEAWAADERKKAHTAPENGQTTVP